MTTSLFTCLQEISNLEARIEELEAAGKSQPTLEEKKEEVKTPQ